MLSYVQQTYAQLQRFPRAVKLFYVADIWFALSRAIFGAIFNLHLLQVGFTENEIGTVQLIASLCSALLAIPVGLLADRYGRRLLYAAGSLLFAIPYLVLPFCTSFPALLLTNTLGSVGLLMAMVNEAPLLAGEVMPEDRPAVFSLMMINFMFWNILGTQLSGLTVRWLGEGMRTPYMPALVVSGLCGMVTALIRLLLPFRSSVPTAPKGARYIPSRVALALAFISLFAGGFTTLTQGFANVILAKRFALSEVAVATTLTLGNAAGWAGALLVPGFSRRLGVGRTFLCVVALQAILLPLMGLLPTAPLFQGAFSFREFLGTMQMTVWGAFAMDAAPEEERATVNSYALVGRSIGTALAAKGFGMALAQGAYLTAFLAAGMLAITCAGSVYLFLTQNGSRARLEA
jgi:DHA1 family multidrug resistance protein-like MFS transporter